LPAERVAASFEVRRILLPVREEQLIIVNAANRAIGRGAKQAVHERGLRHRAFSICLVDADGRMLLQQRSRAKYHSPGLWANSCCGHPRPGERTLTAAHRRLGEELGADARLTFGFTTHYHASFPNGLTENEIVHVYFGRAPSRLAPNPAEVAAVSFVSLTELRRDIRRRPGRYAVWLRHYVVHHFALIRRGVDEVVRRTG
jgi:isopentenyl-diphosphate delta-isomerase